MSMVRYVDGFSYKCDDYIEALVLYHIVCFLKPCRHSSRRATVNQVGYALEPEKV
jgi:hypothetical protein